MNRRTSLSTFIGKAESTSPNTIQHQNALPVGGGLNPHTGTFNYAMAAHLLRRASFGPTHQQIKQAVNDGLNATVTKLLNVQAETTKPLNPSFTLDPKVAVGETWVYTVNTNNVQGLGTYRVNSLRAWIMELIFNEGVSVREKMTMFWHNHFVTSENEDARQEYDYIRLIREFAVGNFKELTQRMTPNIAMLRYLNGNLNTRTAPNENFARELMELFVLGKGNLAGPGDYTTFTEMDVLAVARIMTGFTIPNLNDEPNLPKNIDPITGYYKATWNANRHDTTDKILSHRFNNKIIKNGAENEYKNFIDFMFAEKQQEIAIHLCRKLYRFFIYYKVDAAIENEIVAGLAQVLIDHNFDVKPVLETLFKSQHFYEQGALGCLIKSPYEYIFNVLKGMKMQVPTALADKYSFFQSLFRQTAGMQMTYFDLPSVAGWEAYYQEPGYNRVWINSVTLIQRFGWPTNYINKNIKVNSVSYGLALIDYIDQFTNPSDSTLLINEIIAHQFPQGVTNKQRDALLKSLHGTNGTAAQWATTYNAYKNDSTNATKRTAVEARLRPFTVALVSMSEYHLS
ncbi:MAG: DUF1800 domain-containing protein [Bacteroidota bacterium]|nr:DUF1800 domain-containing protein [Bacteroidota bacterium]